MCAASTTRTAGTASSAVHSPSNQTSVLGAGLGEPGAALDGVSVDADRLAGGRDAAFAVQEEFQELDGLLEGTAGATDGGERVGVGGEAEGGHQLLLAGVEGGPGGELAVQPGADLHPGQEGGAGECGGVGAGFEVGAQQVVLAVPVRSVQEAPVGAARSGNARNCGSARRCHA